MPQLAPDIAVEVLSHGNTLGEMQRKLGEFFSAGVRLVWLVDPNKRSVTVNTSPEDSSVLQDTDTLNAGDVLPGFSMRLSTLFTELDRHSGK